LHEPERATETLAPYRWYGVGVASWAGGFGVQAVVFAHLLTNELGIAAAQLGVAQALGLLPQVAFVLVGGALADRRDPRRVLIGAHLLVVLPVLALVLAMRTDLLTIASVIACGLAMSTIGAFAQPARDSQLSHVAGADMLRAVAGMTIMQFTAQALGSVGAGAATQRYGVVPVLLVQAAILLSGAASTARIPITAPHAVSERRSTRHEITEAFGVVFRTPELRAPILLVLAVGTCFMGPFLVALPLLVRDVYDGGARELGWINGVFPLGTIAGSLALRAAGVRVRGRAALLALAAGSVMLLAIARGLPFWGALLATAGWGVCAGVFLNCTRAMFQEAAPAALRARALAVFQLAFVAAAPVGALLAGLSSGAIGVLRTLDVYAIAMLVVVGALWLLTPTARMR